MSIPKLTPAIAISLTGKRTEQIESLELANKGIESIEELSALVELKRLNLAKNQVSELPYISDNRPLKWLNLSENKMTSMKDLARLKNLTVLNVSKNELFRISDLDELVNLNALILNNNRIRKMEGLATLKELNTLVLSHNEIEAIEGLPKHSKLEKLSLSHNSIRVIPNIAFLIHLKELRLNSNKLLRVTETLKLNSKLTVLDVGSNRIASLKDVMILKEIPTLRSLILKGNPVCNAPDYRDQVLDMLPELHDLDGIPNERAPKKLKRTAKVHLEAVSAKKAEKEKNKEEKQEERNEERNEKDQEREKEKEKDNTNDDVAEREKVNSRNEKLGRKIVLQQKKPNTKEFVHNSKPITLKTLKHELIEGKNNNDETQHESSNNNKQRERDAGRERNENQNSKKRKFESNNTNNNTKDSREMNVDDVTPTSTERQPKKQRKEINTTPTISEPQTNTESNPTPIVKKLSKQEKQQRLEELRQTQAKIQPETKLIVHKQTSNKQNKNSTTTKPKFNVNDLFATDNSEFKSWD